MGKHAERVVTMRDIARESGSRAAAQSTYRNQTPLWAATTWCTQMRRGRHARKGINIVAVYRGAQKCFG